MKAVLLLAAIAVGCGGSVEPTTCQHEARAIVTGLIDCEPLVSPTCGYGVHNRPVPLDQSGEALAYYCTCNSAGKYACFGSPSLAVAEPLD